MRAGRYYPGDVAIAFDVKVEESATGDLSIHFENGERESLWWSNIELREDPTYVSGLSVSSVSHPQQKLVMPLDWQVAEEMRKRLFPKQPRDERRWRVTWTSVTIACLAIFALAFLGMHRVSSAIVSLVPRSLEEHAFRNSDFIAACKTNAQEDAALSLMTQAIYPTFDQDRDLKVRVRVIDLQMVNAFAFPGGNIYLTKGLLSHIKSPEALMGVLAHEIAHVELRHSLKNYFNHLATSMFLGGLKLDGTVGNITAQAWTSRYSREAETEADLRAVERLRRSQVDPRGFIAFFEPETKVDGVVDKYLGWLSSHPGGEDRQALLRAESVGKTNYRPIIWPPEVWDTLKGICGR